MAKQTSGKRMNQKFHYYFLLQLSLVINQDYSNLKHQERSSLMMVVVLTLHENWYPKMLAYYKKSLKYIQLWRTHLGNYLIHGSKICAGLIHLFNYSTFLSMDYSWSSRKRSTHFTMTHHYQKSLSTFNTVLRKIILLLSYILTIKQLPTGEDGNPIMLSTFEGHKGDKSLPQILLYGFVQVFLSLL